MSWDEVIFSSAVLQALMAQALIMIVLMLATARLAQHLGDHDFESALLRHVFIPLGKVISLIAFLLLAYPHIFGITQAPTLDELFAANPMRWHHLINVAFIVSLVIGWLPLPFFGQAMLLPLQSLFATAMLFRWMGEHVGITVSYWPDSSVIIGVSLWAVLSYWVTKHLSQWIKTYADERHRIADGDVWFYQTSLLSIQAPALLMYSLHLGQQWPV